MMGLPESQKSFKIGLAFRHNTGVWWTERQTPYDGKDRAMQSIAQVKLNIS